MFDMRAISALVAACALSLAGCNSLLGDFKYDPNATGKGGSGAGGNGGGVQGDIFVTPASGLVTTEQGGKAVFGIALKRQPTSNVTIALSSSNPAEGSVSPISVSFTPENFAAPQMVQVVGVDDDQPDQTQTYYVRTTPATSEDKSYHNFDPIDPEVQNIDDETAGFTLTPLTGLVTTESGGEATFTVVLNHAPTADVAIPLSSDNSAEGTVVPEMLTFTPLNWMAPQTVTLTGVNDDSADGPVVYHAVTGDAVSADTDYLLNPVDVEVTNQDNDSAGVTLTPATGLLTFESGAMTSFGIALNSPPMTDVTIALTSSNEAEGTVAPASVTFTPLNWMAPQAVTITGVDDERFDGNQPFLIVTSVSQTDDEGYGAIDPPDASVTNIDDDSPGLTVTPVDGLITGEDGAGTTFSVALSSKPNGDVTLDATSSRPEEGVVSPAQLVFTEQNWNAPQVVTISGQDDAVADGMQTYVVHVAPNESSADPAYVALLEVDVNVSNTDNDSAGITVNAPGTLATAERGDSTLFTIVLNSEPRKDVSIFMVSSDTGEGTVSPNRVLFTPQNWAAPQTVTIKGVDDAMADGNQPYRIITEAAVSEDAAYGGMNPANVDVVNTDDDSPGITVRPSGQTLTTTEGGGMATFTVVLNSQPSNNADVNIPVSSNNTNEGTVNPGNLRFTVNNWNAPQTVTIKGVNDDVADGAQPYRIRLAPAESQDPNYNGRDANDVNASNVDNDSAGITVTGADNLTVSERGDTATFQIVLNSKPTAGVNLAVSSSRSSEGTVSPAQIAFTTSNWNAPQTVTVKGVDDSVADGNQTLRVVIGAASSGDGNYAGRDPNDPTVTNVDNDSAGITVKFTAGLTTSEQAGTATFTVVLNSQPTADVTVPLRSSNTKEGTISPGSLSFTAANWAAPRTVTITGVDDKVADGAQPYTVLTDAAVSVDAKYADLDAVDVPVSNVDNDSAGITVSDATGNTKENGPAVSFTIVLNSEPRSDVSIALKSSNTKEGAVSPAAVLFTPVNWSAPQKITVTGVDDKVADGMQPYTIETAPAVSNDAGYKDLDPRDISLSNVDDDSAGITVSAVKGDTTEAGGSTTFSIVLNSQPTADVSIPLSSSNTFEGKLSVTSVTFTNLDWAAPKNVTVTGADDDVADGNQPFMIVTAPATSADKGYQGIDAVDVAVLNIDNDSAGITVAPTSGIISEAGANNTFSFTVVLTSKPTASVSIPVSSGDTSEGSVSPAMLSFSTSNWNTAQTVLVSGVNDDFADGTQVYKVLLGLATSTDAKYAGIDPTDVSMSTTDNDSAGIEVSAAAGSTSESGANTSFSIVLRSEPTAGVTIALSSSDVTEGRLTVTQVAFTTSNWNVPQVVIVHGEDDEVADGSQPYLIRTAAAVSTDTDYDGINPDDVSISNVDDDMAGITVSGASGPTSEAGTTATFTIQLNSEPSANVSVPVASLLESEGIVTLPASGELLFTAANWDEPQTVTVQGVNDEMADGTQPYVVSIGPATSTDPKYSGQNPTDLTLTNEDDEPPP